jgi:hypothetical protein
MEMRYDGHGNQIESAFFQGDGKTAAWHQDGYHRMEQQYDEHDNEKELAYFGPKGRPVETTKGFHKRTRGYDKLGYLNAEAYFDRDGRPVVPLWTSYHRWTARLDENGNRIEEAFFGAGAKPMLYKNAYHKRKMEYGPRGNMRVEVFFDRGNRPIAVRGVARWTCRYDDQNQIFDVEAFDIYDKPVPFLVTVTRVEPQSQAEELGLRKGDVLLAYDGRPVVNTYRLFRQRRSERPSDRPRKLLVRRQNKTFTFEVPPGKLGEIGINNRPAPGSR